MNPTLLRLSFVFVLLAASLSTAPARAAERDTLRICGDPGNMPLINNRGEGFLNKIAERLAEAMNVSLQYDWRPSTERGLLRATLNADYCDLMMNVPAGMERVLTTAPLYRSSFVLVSRSENGYQFSGLDDPKLKQLKVGVYQMSEIRLALADAGVKNNTVLHYISYDGDRVPEHQPSYQVQRVIDGELDVAAIWGPFAGYFKTIKQAPLTIQPVNLLDDSHQLEFDMVMAVRSTDHAFRDRVQQAMEQERASIEAILREYGVPLVRCEQCVIEGDLPSHGPYELWQPGMRVAAGSEPPVEKGDLKRVEQWLADGADVNDELQNAIVANDIERVRFLIKHGADVDAVDHEGYAPLHNAARRGYVNVARALIEAGADVNAGDRDGWTALMFSAWADNAEIVRDLAAAGADLRVKDPRGLTSLGIATMYEKVSATYALIDAGADINAEMGGAGYTPLMLTALSGSGGAADALIRAGAEVNARNSAGVTALMIAAAQDSTAVAETLIRAGADTEVQTDDGRTALSIARERDSEGVLPLLQARAGHSRSDERRPTALRNS